MAKLTPSQVLDAIEAQERAALGSHHGLTPSQVLDELETEGVLDQLELEGRREQAVEAAAAATQQDPFTQPRSTPWGKRLRSDLDGCIVDLEDAPQSEPAFPSAAALPGANEAADAGLRPAARPRLRRLK